MTSLQATIQTVLITGASSGLGYAFAKIFAHNGYNLVLVARNQDELEKIARDLQKEYAIFVKVIAKDLAESKSPEEIYKEVTDDNIIIDILINNAGFGTHGRFYENDTTKELAEIQVNIATVTHLTRLFLPDMVKRKAGKILNVASTAAFFPGPFMAVYYATKAYVLSFSEALAEEVKGTGVIVSVLCPGPTKTGFARQASLEKTRLFQGKKMEASDVVRIAYEGLMQGKTVIIPGLRNKLQTEAVRFVPRSIVPKIIRKFQEV